MRCDCGEPLYRAVNGGWSFLFCKACKLRGPAHEAPEAAVEDWANPELRRPLKPIPWPRKKVDWSEM